MNEKLYNNNKFSKRVADSVNNNNRTLIIGFSNSIKTYLMNYFLLQKQELILELQNH